MRAETAQKPPRVYETAGLRSVFGGYPSKPSQPMNVPNCRRAGDRGLHPFHYEMLGKKLSVLFVVVKALRCENCRYYRDLCFKLNAHQRTDHGLGYEFVSIDAAIHDKSGRDNSGVAATLGKKLAMQRNFQRTRHLEEVDVALGKLTLRHVKGE